MDSWAQLLTALRKLPWASVTEAIPGPIVAGSVWAALASFEPINQCAWLDRYYVFIALPGGLEASTVETARGIRQDVADVVFPVAKLVTGEPWQLPVEPGQQAIPVLRFTLEM